MILAKIILTLPVLSQYCRNTFRTKIFYGVTLEIVIFFIYKIYVLGKITVPLPVPCQYCSQTLWNENIYSVTLGILKK